MFVDQNGKEYTEDSEIDVTTNTILRPKYINAGYEAIEDKFGDYSLKMVYIPGTNGEKWIGDKVNETNFPTEKKGLKEGYLAGVRDNNIAQPDKYLISTGISNALVADKFLTREIVYRAVVSGVASVSGNTVTVRHPKTGNTTFTFSNASILSTASNGSLYTYNTNKNAAWGNISHRDAFVAANMFTCIYNAFNPNLQQLTYAYKNSDGTVLTNWEHHTNVAAMGWALDGNSTGYRLPTFTANSYWNHIITDERQLCYENIRKPSGYDYPLSYSKDESGLSYAYKNSYDGNTAKNSYYGSAAGLAVYNKDTGVYDRTRMRTGNVAQGKSASAGLSLTYNQEADMNTRNGAGLYMMSGLMANAFESFKGTSLIYKINTNGDRGGSQSNGSSSTYINKSSGIVSAYISWRNYNSESDKNMYITVAENANCVTAYRKYYTDNYAKWGNWPLSHFDFIYGYVNVINNLNGSYTRIGNVGAYSSLASNDLNRTCGLVYSLYGTQEYYRYMVKLFADIWYVDPADGGNYAKRFENESRQYGPTVTKDEISKKTGTKYTPLYPDLGIRLWRPVK